MCFLQLLPTLCWKEELLAEEAAAPATSQPLAKAAFLKAFPEPKASPGPKAFTYIMLA
jgi:hypothetical protein